MSKVVRIVIPVVDEEGWVLSEHFGRAPFFAVYQVNGSNIAEKEVFPNRSDHFGGSGHPPEYILGLGAEVVISLGMGMRAINEFQKSGVAVLKSETVKSEEALQFFQQGKLKELTEGCLHSHEH